MRHTVVLFGEAEKGQFQRPYPVKDLSQLIDSFGHPPPESEGLFFAIQALLFERDLLYFRVTEEGFSANDYLKGFHILQNSKEIAKIDAICLPGVGDNKILKASEKISHKHKSFLIVDQKALFDYLTM